MKKIEVLAISGSLRSPSFTEKMLDLCITGMGSDINLTKFYPHKMNIGPCTSCWSCWGKKNPGQCVQKDDFQQIMDAYEKADYFLWAFPLYVFDMPATVKNVLDRFFVLQKPTQIPGSDGLTEHPKRSTHSPKAVLISSCGFPKIENFELLRKHFEIICRHMGWQQAGEVLISASGADNIPSLFDDKLELIKKAGQELLNGNISPQTTQSIATPVIRPKDYRDMANAHFEGGIGAKLKMMTIGLKAIQQMKKSD